MTNHLTGDVTRVAIVGAAGRMGRHLVMACADAEDVQLTQASEKSGSALIGADAGIVSGIGVQNVLISETLDVEQFDVFVV